VGGQGSAARAGAESTSTLAAASHTVASGEVFCFRIRYLIGK
jgi:hypothetical protein